MNIPKWVVWILVLLIGAPVVAGMLSLADPATVSFGLVAVAAAYLLYRRYAPVTIQIGQEKE